MSFSLNNFDAIGFDIDHAFIQYRLENLFPLVYNSMCRNLVEEKGYSKELLQHPFSSLSDFSSRGLILDAVNGDLLKISKDGKVLRASHGTHIMDESQLDKKYGKDRKWAPYESFIEGLKSQGNFLRKGYNRMFDNFFDIPAMLLCAQLVDFSDIEVEEGQTEKYKKIWPDVLSALVMNFSYSSFAENKGYFYPAMKAEPQKYIEKTSDKKKKWLKNLRNEGKKLFLATNSQADFSMFVLDYAFGNDWRAYVDIYVSRAEKPGFFRSGNPFVEVVNRMENKDPVENLEEDKNYASGSSTLLQKYLQKLCGKTNVKVLFCGDSLLSDIYPPNCFSNWQTVALLEELDYEMEDNASENGDDEENNMDAPEVKKRKSNDGINKRKDILTSKLWGSIFGENNELMNTLFSHFVDKYSALVLASLDSITDLPIDHVFEKNLKDGTRFYPQIPRNSS